MNIAEQYERLRQNALGRVNQPRGLLLFVQQGMCSWLRAFSTFSAPPPLPDDTGLNRPAGSSTNGLAAILADAILTTATEPAITGDTP